MAFTTIDGLNTRYEVTGSGPPLLMYAPGGFDATLSLPPPSYARRSGEIVAAQLAQVGVRAHIEDLEWAQWLGRVYGDHDFDMSIVAHTEPMDYGVYARDSYYFGYHSPAYQALMTQADAAVDPARRHALLGALQRRIAEDSVNVFLFELPALGVWDRHLKGVAIDQVVQQNGMVDAWFDVTTAATSLDRIEAIVLAVAVELPTAALSLFIARRAITNLSAVVAAVASDDTGPIVPPL